MEQALAARLLRRAAEIVGGTAQLCYDLHVPSSELARWLAGEEEMPRGVFLKVVDIVLADLASSGLPLRLRL
jgi:hypothetical protein